MPSRISVRKHCPLSESIKKVAAAHLRRSGLAIYGDGRGGASLMSEGDKVMYTELISLEDAWRGGLLQVGEDGSLTLCGQAFKPDWDQAKIRRKLEDRLRKISTTGELIKVAACLGVEIH